MKRSMLPILAALMLCPALAEGGLTGALATPAPAVTSAPTATPTPTPAPTHAVFAAEGLDIPLPDGFEPLTGDALAAYEAAVRFDYPGATETILAATSEDGSAAMTVAAVESKETCLDAARAAAEALIDNADAAKEERFGENEGAGFACAIEEQTYRLYFFSDGDRLIVIGFTGLETDEIEELLAELEID